MMEEKFHDIVQALERSGLPIGGVTAENGALVARFGDSGSLILENRGGQWTFALSQRAEKAWLVTEWMGRVS